MPPKASIAIAPAHIVERVGEDVVVFLPESKEVVKLSGEIADLVYSASTLGSFEVPDTTDLSELVERGIVVFDSQPSRRAILKFGAVGVGASVVALGLPSVAAASSVIQLTGKWFYFRTNGGGFQDFLVSGSFPGSGLPSALAIPSGTADLLGMDGDEGIGNIQWEFPVDSITDPFPTSGENITGTFTWPGTSLSYSVTFVYDPALNGVQTVG